MFRINLQSLGGAGLRHIEIAGEAVSLLEAAVNSRAFADLVKSDSTIQNWRKANDETDRESRLFGFIESLEQSGESSLDFCIDLDVALSIRPGRGIPKPEIETPYWLIDDCLRRRDALGLACHWICEWLRVPETAGRSDGDLKLSLTDKAVGPEIAESVERPLKFASRGDLMVTAIAVRLAECVATATRNFKSS